MNPLLPHPAMRDVDPFARLAGQLHEATQAASNAYRDSGRLIRLLGVLGSPAAPGELLGRALAVLSEAYNADLVCVVSPVGDRFLVTAARGLAEDDPSFVDTWQLGPVAAQAIHSGQPAAVRLEPGEHNPDVPASLAPLGLRSAAFVPMSPLVRPSDEMLVLCRSSGEPFTGTDLHVLGSVAQRLAVAAQDRERAVAIERLAESGHRLTAHIDPGRLMTVAAEVIHRLTMADVAWVMEILDGTAYLRAQHGDRTGAGPAQRVPVGELDAWPTVVTGASWSAPLPRDGELLPRAGLCVPVMRDGRPILLLYATRSGPRLFSPEVVEIAEIFARNLGGALVNADLYQELHDRATLDPLTGLANRTVAGQRLEQVLGTSATTHANGLAGLLFCDLDGFKAINDRLGHEVGDALLQQVARRLQHGLRPSDLLARFGGDEFIAVLSAIDSLADVTAVGRRLVDALAEPFQLGGERVNVSASIGGVLGVRGRSTASAMLRDADAAMYVAKSRGRGVVEVFDDAASHRSLDRLSVRSELLLARDRGEFEVLYQPIVALGSGRPVAFEALLRWTHHQRGPIPPDVFIPLAEETGEIGSIGTWVMEQACRQLASWRRLPGWSELTINVNLAPSQLARAGTAAEILELVRRTGVEPGQLWLEVTEKSRISDDVAAATEQLRAGGVRFALDDFGSAYSNLAYLKQFPAECLKIDRSFVDGVDQDGTDRSIVRAILAMAGSLRLTVVAEGIERTGQRDALLGLGCELGQGFLFAPGLSAASATRLLTGPAVCAEPRGYPESMMMAGATGTGPRERP